MESLKPAETRALAKAEHVTGDGTGPWEGPEPVRPKAAWSDTTAEGPRQAPAGTRERAHSATTPK